MILGHGQTRMSTDKISVFVSVRPCPNRSET